MSNIPSINDCLCRPTLAQTSSEKKVQKKPDNFKGESTGSLPCLGLKQVPEKHKTIENFQNYNKKSAISCSDVALWPFSSPFLKASSKLESCFSSFKLLWVHKSFEFFFSDLL